MGDSVPSVGQKTKNKKIFQGLSRVSIRAAGRVRSFSNTRGSSRFGSGGVRDLMGRAGSIQEGFKYHGSGRATLNQPEPTRE